ncbi:MAG: domain protein putative component of TonB system, partial [Myxococcaceae bacterium]|nr:domain protein putative component of TonB system [Myxococcaceae bacterium]
MSAKTIRNALGVLQENPDDDKAWSELERSLTDATDMAEGELPELLEAARRAHEGRREYDAVARLLAIEVKLAAGTPAEADLVGEQARVLDDELLDDEAAVLAFTRLLELRPGDTRAEESIEKAQGKRGKWLELTKRYIEESKSAGEPSFKSSLLVSAAEVAYRYGRPAFSAPGEKNSKKKLDALNKQIVEGLSRALEVDPKNRRAALLLERVHRGLGNNEAAAKVIEHLAGETNAKDEKIAAYIRLARVSKRDLDDNARAMRAYEQVIDLSPGHPEATSALVEHFSEKEDWDHLVSLYEGQLAATSRNTAHDAGTLLQLAMVHWKMRGRPESAEPFFERLRRLEPAHAGTIAFFRDYLGERGDTARLTSILTDAHRAMPDGEAKAALVAELAKLNEQGENSTKAIEQWRALLRQDPKNNTARDALKRLYRQTAGWSALADLLRAELEKIPADDKAARLPVLREIAQIYGEQVKSDSALVTVLSQIIALDPTDATAVRELVRVYASLGRWRDLLTTQSRLAEIESDPAAKAVLYRDVARRWLEQFSNVQNAVEAYEKLHEVVPEDQEANDKLRELYTKRRAYKPLFELLEGVASRTEDSEARRALWMEMAKLASERLDRGADASKLYKKILEEEPTQTVALDALEKQAERDKDFATVAEVLERRVDLAPDAATKLVVLQKLGAIYSDRLKDHTSAMRAWKRVLDLSPGHAKGLRVLRDTYLAAGDYDGLTELYSGSNDWEGLAEVLSSAGDKATDPNTKIELSYRA